MAGNTGEPTYTDDDGKEQPGAVPLNTVITPTRVTEIEKTWADLAADLKYQNHYSSQFPTISEPYAPLDTLITNAYKRFGNMSADTLDGDTKMILFAYANKIVDDIRSHPYSSMPTLDYYKALSEWRPIPDEIMMSGLTYHYSKWLSSDKTKLLYAEYVQTLNQILYQHKYGSGRIETNTVDKDATR